MWAYGMKESEIEKPCIVLQGGMLDQIRACVDLEIKLKISLDLGLKRGIWGCF